jgi:glycosyltransferase involved in cell wall biosynthesis
MRILFLTNLYPPNVFGGYEKICHKVATALQARGHEVTVLTSSYGKNNGENYGHKVRRELFLFATAGNIYAPFDCPPEQRSKHEITNCHIFETVIDEVKPDILFVWNLFFFNGGLLKAIDNCPLQKTYLLTDNWLIAQLNPQFLGMYFSNKVFSSHPKKRGFIRALRYLANPIARFFVRNSFIMNGHAIFPSRFMRQLYKEAGVRFNASESICYHGVRFPHPPDAARAQRIKLGNSNVVRLLVAGRVVKVKGVHTAIEAIHSIRKRCGERRILLTIVGDTQDQDYYKELERLIDSVGMRDSISFQPAVTEDKLFNLFQEHDIYLFPSLYEPFSLTLILALESGIPTIASNAGGTIEIISDEKTGLLFRAGDYKDLAEKIYSLIMNGKLRARISRSAVDRAANFTFDKMISRIELELRKEIALDKDTRGAYSVNKERG